MRQVANRSAAAVDAGGADFDKTQRRMEGIGCRIRGYLVDLADNTIVSGVDDVFEQIAVEPSRTTASAG